MGLSGIYFYNLISLKTHPHHTETLCLNELSGPLDEDGQPHGFCTVTYSSSDRFEGHFTHGEKNGKGKFFFFDGRYCKHNKLRT